MHAFWIALQFLTRIPVRLSAMPSPEQMGRSLLWYPAVGLLIGLVLLGLQNLLQGITPALQAALLLMVWVLLTGGLHLDGLADSADAWAGGLGDRERSLAIMKDPRSGPIAIVVLVLVLLLKYAALQQTNALAVLFAPWLARGLLPLLFWTTPYVRSGGLGALLTEHLPRGWIPWVLVLHAVMLLCWGGWFGVLAVAAALGCFMALRYLMQQRLGGTTGDTAGALVELAEVSVLVLLSIWVG